LTDTFEIGVQLFPGSGSDAVRDAQLCEDLEFDSVWLADHFHGAGRDASWVVPECLSVLAAMAVATKTIRVGTCVVSAVKREPCLLAHSALTINELAGGRFDLGIGTGFGPDLHAFGFDTSKAAHQLREAISVVRLLSRSLPTAGVRATIGERQLDGAFLHVGDVHHLPILVAAIGPKLLELTRQEADGWIPFGLSPELYRIFLSSLGVVGRPFRPLLWLPTFVSRPGDDRGDEAEATGRMYLSMAPQVVRAAASGWTGPELPSSLAWTPETSREVARRISKELARDVTLHGPPAECVKQLWAFAAAGCKGVILRLPNQASRTEELRLIAREIVVPFRAALEHNNPTTVNA
jgi:alkanesulfonate monooxygenase SsuD/methylene tetrahydromethanopterin reductase-like flavin-dependent oxidoreductase (luciferase family)